MKGITTSVTIQVNMPRERFFYWLVSVDLEKIMHAYAILPGVSSVRNQIGPMYQSGASREIVFTDGSTADEEIVSSDPPESNNYKVFNLTSMFRYLVRDGAAQFNFREKSPSVTIVHWQYTFFGHNWLAELILWPLVSTLWKGFMRQTLLRSKLLAEEEYSSHPASAAA